jgi:hypothetical protein
MVLGKRIGELRLAVSEVEGENKKRAREISPSIALTSAESNLKHYRFPNVVVRAPNARNRTD